MKTLRRSLLLLPLLLAAACSTPDSRIKDNAAAFNACPPEVQAKIRAGEVAVGFTPEMVTLALGKADEVYRRQTKDGESEIWAYRDKRPRIGIGIGVGGFSGHTGGGVGVSTSTGGDEGFRLQVVFREGKVTAIESRKR